MKRRHRIGAHTSAAGGVHRAAEEAVAIGCNTVQVFTRSPRMWRGTAPSAESVARLAALRREHDLRPLAVHGCYLTNLAAADPEVQRRSRESFRLEIENARAIGAEYLVIHPEAPRARPGARRSKSSPRPWPRYSADSTGGRCGCCWKTPPAAVTRSGVRSKSWPSSAKRSGRSVMPRWDSASTPRTASKPATTLRPKRACATRCAPCTSASAWQTCAYSMRTTLRRR